MKALKEEITIIGQNIEFAKEKLISEFEMWYEKKFGTGVVLSREETRMPIVFEEGVNEDLDSDALAYISAKRNVNAMHKGKKTIGKA